MDHIYNITGMTCNGCVASVSEKLSRVDGVTQVEVDLERAEAQISMEKHIPIATFNAALPDKYSISEKGNGFHKITTEPDVKDSLPMGIGIHGNENKITSDGQSKLQQLKPLLLIFLYLFATAFLLNFRDWNTSNAMLDFMGLFYIVFSFFKLLDLKGFPESFRMYDPLAKVLPVYGWVYPFIEVGLGLMFLFRFRVTVALMVTIFILGMTTIGVVKTLLDKKSIRCACLGTALKLPMTEATFIENAIMLVMAVAMLTQLL